MKKMNLNNETKFTELERGDYQTPSDFAKKVCEYIKIYRGCNPTTIIEPTCGEGNLIDASIKVFDNIKKVYGIELDGNYYKSLEEKFKNNRDININLFNENIFNFNFDIVKKNVKNNELILAIGNPPWVTNTKLESISSINLPEKENLKKLNGFDALTGKSNFDISEYIILKLIENFQGQNATIAMLCKNTVIRNIVRDINILNLNISNIEMINFNAKKVFNISCDASLLILDISDKLDSTVDVYDVNWDELNSDENNYDINSIRNKVRTFGWDEKYSTFISDIDMYNDILNIDGECIFEWRQGIKHDCSKVMQLTKDDGFYINGNKKRIELEDNYVYPLIKSSDIKTTEIKETRKYVIVTQKNVKQDTSIIELEAPNLWNYLNEHGEFLDNRKSSIYKKAPRFAIFGVGKYSFATYKVCISGFYKEPRFALAYREDESPIMLDDTCYFLGFNNYKIALITTILLNSNIVNRFLKSIAFLDAKRPYTKEILKRIDIEKLYNNLNYEEFIDIKNQLEIDEIITEDEYLEYGEIFCEDEVTIIED